MPLPLSLSVRTESWPIAGAFSISRGAKTEAQVVVVELSDGRHKGRGECVPYARYGETLESVTEQIRSLGPSFTRASKLADSLTRFTRATGGAKLVTS